MAVGPDERGPARGLGRVDDRERVAVLSGPSNGSDVRAEDGTGTYPPEPAWSGTDYFSYRVTDGRGGADTATVTVRVNGSPDAVDDERDTAADTSVDVAVLANDTDPQDDPLTVVHATQAAHGSTLLVGGTHVRYAPDTGWAGDDTFTYRVADSRGLTTEATVTVTTANSDPVAHPDTASTATDTPVAAIDVLVNDTDVNVTAAVPGQRLSVSGAAADADATVTVADDDTLAVTPAAGYAGPVTVTYTVIDGAGGTATGTLVVTVHNAAPTAHADGPVRTAADTSTLVDVLHNDTDPNGDRLAIEAGSVTAPLDGQDTPRGTAVVEDGKVRYTPPTGFAGTVSFGVTVTDGHGGTSTAPVTVVVDNAPPVAVDDVATTPSGTPVSVDVLANDTDPNRPGTEQELDVTQASADAGATVTVDDDGRLTLTPAVGHEGDVTVTYTVSDGAGGTDVGVLVVTVANAAPLAADDAATSPYLAPVDIDLLANDTDVNAGDVLHVVPGSLGEPVDGTGRVRGTVTLFGAVATYRPPAGFSGPVTFGYGVTDGTDVATATVTVTVDNAPPVVQPHSMRAVSGQTLRLDVLGTDHDPEGGELWIVAVDEPEHGELAIDGGKFLLYTPAPGHTGAVTLGYTVADAAGARTQGSATVDVVAAEVPAGPPVSPPVGTPVAPGTGGAPAGPATVPGVVAVRAATALARTGADMGTAVLVVMLLVAGGTAMTLVARRRGV